MTFRISHLFLILNISIRFLETSTVSSCIPKVENELTVEIGAGYLEDCENGFSGEREYNILMDDEYDDTYENIELEDGALSDDASIELLKYCPHDCVCQYYENYANFGATCSRLDSQTQSFVNITITYLVVIDVDPQYPVVLDDNLFIKIGLENVGSIEISNSTVKYISSSAFIGLNNLYAVNFTNVGIDYIHPDAFAKNTLLKILTLSGNNLKHTNYMFKSSSLEALDISNCNMQEFSPTAFSEVKYIMYINLAGNSLEALPEGIFYKKNSIQELDLSNNKIVTLPVNIFETTSLKYLNLNRNEIVSNLEFVTKEVQKLDVSYNKITSLNNQMFRTMENLSFLSLKGNKINDISPYTFVTLKNLRHIDLSFNDLDQLSSLVFLMNSDLKVIRINDNIKLKTLPIDGFETNAKSFQVSYFDASNCNLSSLSENTFKTMPFITKLVLSGNNIENIPKGLFSPLLRLMELDLSNNSIVYINSQVFWNNLDLENLNLAANPLKSITPKVFRSTPYLRELDISDCDLRTIWKDLSLNESSTTNIDNNNFYASDWSKMEYLRVFKLKNNPLECNDEFKSLIEYMKLKNVIFGYNNSYNDLEKICDEQNRLIDKVESITGDTSIKEENEAIEEDYNIHSFEL